MPYALLFLIFFSLQADLTSPYGDYHFFWQAIGFIFPISGLLVFILSFIICKEPEPFDHDVDAAFDENDHAGVGDAEKAFADNAKEIELAEKAADGEPIGEIKAIEAEPAAASPE